jgi:hypothetical protein
MSQRRGKNVGKIFDKIGARDFRIDKVEDHRVKELAHANCPSCGVGPMDGVTGLRLKTIEPPGFGKDPPGFGKAPWDVVDADEFEPVYPTNGAPTVCGYCGELCIFREKEPGTLTIEIPTPAEVKEWKLDPNIWKVLSSAMEHFQQVALEARLRGDMRYAKFRPRRF